MTSVRAIKWVKSELRPVIFAAGNLTGAVLLILTNSVAAFAQTGADAAGKFKAASDTVVKAIQQISLIAVVLLLVAGFGLLMWGGVTDALRIRAVRIIFFVVAGGAGLFLFAQPIGDLLTSTFSASTSAAK